MNRREFLKKATMAGIAGVGGLQIFGRQLAADEKEPEVFVAEGGEPEELLRAGLKSYGAFGKLIKSGSTVVIKANFSWYGNPEKGCNTNPDLLAALVKTCREAGAKKVRVLDLAIDPAAMCLKLSGIKAAVEAAGGEVADLLRAATENINSGSLKNFPVYTEALRADCLINVPILKSHGVTVMTAALKNLMGLTPDRQAMHRLGIHETIVDLASVIKPHFHIIDAYRVMKTRGPQGPGKVDLAKQLILGHDPVACDAYAATVLDPDLEIKYLTMAGARGIGEVDLKKIKITKVNVKGA